MKKYNNWNTVINGTICDTSNNHGEREFWQHECKHACREISGFFVFKLGVIMRRWKKYDRMKKYYLMAIDKGNSDAAVSLGDYYRDTEKNFDEMKKYYLMAIDNGNSDAMVSLGYYYRNTVKNFDEMKKYYLMAIDKDNHITAMYNLGYHYQHDEIKHDKMKKYYSMVLDNIGNQSKTSSIHNLGVAILKTCIYDMTNTLNMEKTFVIDIYRKNNIKPTKFKNKIDEYIILSELGYDVHHLMNDRNVCFFANRMKFAKNIDNDCSVCLERNKLAYLECMAHAVCINCYDKCVDGGKCPVCRFDITS